ncbi:unnamed protein product [Notodromas monacha]|uniref:Uncharacterized protein n=1 Tax=Notodromas monacha TaxID=399045 RepID=A0A7R9BI32_9CRUS|nr:unnamed protein product [Notodromas monacha]CAG0914494.1 unnamed protein product [Notodromas monacha]
MESCDEIGVMSCGDLTSRGYIAVDFVDILPPSSPLHQGQIILDHSTVDWTVCGLSLNCLGNLCFNDACYFSLFYLPLFRDLKVSCRLVLPFADSFVNSQEWTLSRNVPDLRLGIVGAVSSGKSALVHRYLTGSYMQEESPEGGRFKKEVMLDGTSYLLLIRDEGGPPEMQLLAGNERYDPHCRHRVWLSMAFSRLLSRRTSRLCAVLLTTRDSFRPSHDTDSVASHSFFCFQFSAWVDAIILVFSVENEASFNAIYNYYSKMSHFRNPQEIPIILVGTQGELSQYSRCLQIGTFRRVRSVSLTA